MSYLTSAVKPSSSGQSTSLFGSLEALPRGPHGLTPEEVAASQRSRLLAAVTALVADVGYPATTITSLCRTAAVSPNGFYAHFDSKEDCFLAAYDVFVAGITDAIASAAARVGPWESFVEEGLRAYLALLDTEPVASRAFVLHVEGAGDRPRAHLRRTLGALAELLRTRHEAMRQQDPSLGALPERAFLGFVWGIRAVVCQAMLEAPDTPLVSLVPDLARWLAATVAGASSTAATSRR